MSQCAKCPDKVMATRWPHEGKRPWCLNSKCWEGKQAEAVAAREKEIEEKLEARGAGAKHERLDYGTYERFDSFNVRFLHNPEECESCEKRHFLKDHKGEYEPVCVDLKCFRQKKARKTKEDNERARQEFQKLTERIDAALAGADPAGRHCSLLALEILLRAGWTEPIQWFSQTYEIKEKSKATITDRLPILLKGKSDEELLRMVPRLAMEIVRHQRSDRLNHYLRQFEGGPQEIELKLEDGSTQRKRVEDIYLVKEPWRKPDDKPWHYHAYYVTDGVTGCMPITEESFKELVALGVKKETDYGG